MLNASTTSVATSFLVISTVSLEISLADGAHLVCDEGHRLTRRDDSSLVVIDGAASPAKR